MLITKEMNTALNEMLSIELTAVKQYMAIGAKFKEMGYNGLAGKFLTESSEEHGHVIKIIDFLIRVGAKVKFTEDKNFKQDFSSVEEMVETALKMESEYFDFQNDLMSKAKTSKDILVENFLVWFLENQVKEINELQDILTKIKKLGEDRLFLLDQMFGKGA